MFWLSIFQKILERENCKSNDLKPIDDFLISSGIGIDKTNKAFRNLIEKVLGKNTHSIRRVVLSEMIDSVESQIDNKEKFSNAIECSNMYLNKNKISAKLLIDSLEDFQLDKIKMQNALQGFFRCVGDFIDCTDSVEVLCSIPGELYFKFREISKASIKDFPKLVLLHWHAKELLGVLCHRYGTYLELYDRERFGRVFGERGREFSRRSVTHLWQEIFPGQVRNEAGTPEGTALYILRHSQLLPRHAILTANLIAEHTRIETNTDRAFEEKWLHHGMAIAREHIMSDIFKGYEYSYRNAEKICNEIIPQLPWVFKESNLSKVYNTISKKYPDVEDYGNFLRMVAEIGAIGRVRDVTDRYVIGEFEYVLPGALDIAKNETLCLHPAFAEKFRAQAINNDKAILPRGSDADGDEEIMRIPAEFRR